MIVFHILGLLLAALIAWASIGSLIESAGSSTGALYGLLFAGLLVVGIWIARKQRRAIHARNKQYKEQQRQRLKEQGIQLSRMDRFGLWLEDQFTMQWVKDFNAKRANGPLPPKPPIEVQMADNRAVQICFRAGVLIFVLGLIFPETGTQALGILGAPIDWAANTVPSIKKLASVSTMPQLVAGYLGAVALMLPVLLLILLYKDPTEARGRFTSGNVKKLKWLLILKAGIFGVLFPLGMVWLFWELPVSVRLGADTGRGQILFHFMMTNRWMLANCVAVIFFTLTIFMFFLLSTVFGFISTLFKKH